jgi:hypothetical protein
MPPRKRKLNVEEGATLRDILHTGRISTRGLSQILRKLKSSPSAVLRSRDQLYDANTAPFDAISVTREVPTKDGPFFSWEFCDPNLLLSDTIARCPKFADAIGRLANEHNPVVDRPWSLVVAFDEFTPGNSTSGTNWRKSMVLSFNFLEFGEHHLRSSNTWLTPIVLRSVHIHNCVGGWPFFLREYLRLHLCGPSGMQTVGCPVLIRNQPLLIHARLKILISDGDGLKLALDWRGAAGLKPCVRHFNVWSKGSDMARRQRGHVDITCGHIDSFREATSAEYYAGVDAVLEAGRRCAAGDLTKARFESYMMCLGLQCNPLGVVACPELRGCFSIPDVVHYDWVHTALQDGFMSGECFRFLEACEAKIPGFSMRELEGYLKGDWLFPQVFKTKSKQLHRVFNAYRDKSTHEHSKLKASASEVLGLYSLIRHFIETQLVASHGALAAERAAFDSACEIVDTIQLAKAGLSTVDASVRLRTLYSEYWRLLQLAYGNDPIKPKHHWFWDIILQLPNCPMVLDQFVIERGHIDIKAIAEHIDNTTRFERSVLSGRLVTQRRQFNVNVTAEGLLGSIVAIPGCIGASVADSLSVAGVIIGVGDMVFLNGVLGKVMNESGLIVSLRCAIESLASSCYATLPSQVSSTFHGAMIVSLDQRHSA